MVQRGSCAPFPSSQAHREGGRERCHTQAGKQRAPGWVQPCSVGSRGVFQAGQSGQSRVVSPGPAQREQPGGRAASARPAPFMPSLNHIPLPLITAWITQLQTGRSLFTFLPSEPCLRCESRLPSRSSGAAARRNKAPGTGSAWAGGNALGRVFPTPLTGWVPFSKQVPCQGLPGNGSTFTLRRFLSIFVLFCSKARYL